MTILGKKILEKTIFVHYGNELFRPEKVEEVAFFQNHYNKPKRGGIWLSPKNSKYGWREWAKETKYPRFHDRYRWEIALEDDAKIIACTNFMDLKSIPTSDLYVDGEYACTYFDYRKLQESGYHGVFLGLELLMLIKFYQKYYEGFTKPTFKFWDCESLLLFGTEKIRHVSSYVQSI